MKMPLADIMDRWSIALLKKHAGGMDVDKEIADLRQAAYETEADKVMIQDWLGRLILHNSLIWSLESDIRLGKEGILGHQEVGRRALLIRDHNANRVKVKQEIAGAVGQHVDKKVNHASQ